MEDVMSLVSTISCIFTFSVAKYLLLTAVATLADNVINTFGLAPIDESNWIVGFPSSPLNDAPA